MIPDAWRGGEVAVVGLARTGLAVTQWLAHQGVRVYASDRADHGEIRRAAGQLAGAHVSVELGRHDLDRIERSVAVIVSPGVPPSAPPVARARAAGVPVRAELDVAAVALAGTKLVVVTGTNGKSTTTALAAHVLECAGVRAEAAGNIGRPLIEVAAEPEPPPWVIVEASSFQLHDAPSLRPTVGVVTNLSPDHLDRYASVEEYYGDKRLLFQHADASATWILNGDDPAVTALAEGVQGHRLVWRQAPPADAWFDTASDRLMLDDRPILDRADLLLLGHHNVENALAASLVARAVGVEAGAIAKGLKSFRGLPHRLEVVRETGGIRWINDSKATNVSSALVAVRAMDGPFILLMGGRHKGESYERLAAALGACRAVVAFGEALPHIVADVRRVDVLDVETLTEAVARAAALARPGDTVLLSPACSSYDQFTNYEERGAAFRHAVSAL